MSKTLGIKDLAADPSLGFASGYESTMGLVNGLLHKKIITNELHFGLFQYVNSLKNAHDTLVTIEKRLEKNKETPIALLNEVEELYQFFKCYLNQDAKVWYAKIKPDVDNKTLSDIAETKLNEEDLTVVHSAFKVIEETMDTLYVQICEREKDVKESISGLELSLQMFKSSPKLPEIPKINPNVAYR